MSQGDNYRILLQVVKLQLREVERLRGVVTVGSSNETYLIQALEAFNAIANLFLNSCLNKVTVQLTKNREWQHPNAVLNVTDLDGNFIFRIRVDKLSAEVSEKVRGKMSVIYKTNLESVWTAYPTGCSLITGNIMHSDLNRLVWQEMRYVPMAATPLTEEGLHWRIPTWLMSLVFQQTGGRQARRNGGFMFAHDNLDNYGLVMPGSDAVYRVRFYKGQTDWYKPTFVVEIEPTGFFESDSGEVYHKKVASRIAKN